MNWGISVCFDSLVIFSLSWSVFGTLYTRCNSLSGVGYRRDPLFTGTCKTLMEAASQCLKCSMCDLISKDGTQCSFHTAIDRNVTCGNGGMSSGTIFHAQFRSCNCTLIEDFWVGTGSFYLYVTPDIYTCDQGQDVCMSLGGTMAEVYNIDELNFALTVITGIVFVGGQIQGNTYVWTSTGQEIDASLWVPGEPNDMAQCVQIWNNALDDVFFTYLRPILCQKGMTLKQTYEWNTNNYGTQFGNNIKLIQQQQGMRNGFDTPIKHTVDVCMSHGGIMAEFYTIDELNYALAYVTGDIFVGGHFLNGKYVWKTTNQEIEASLWVPGQPVDFEDAPCVQIWHSNGGIDDFWPTQYRPILCQKLRVVATKVNFITPN